ncbi:MAG: argininosuccinate lyase, partial [Actinobacteria bacterium]|nr:argininosuccinate lyase [Actinomycetota bacterium]
MSENGSNALWGSRFDGGPADSLAALSRSVHFDWRLAQYDIKGTLAHIKALHAAGYLTVAEHQKLEKSLEELARRVAEGSFTAKPTDEDVHSALERGLIEIAGAELGGKVRAGRSRNDQIATLIRTYLLDQADIIEDLVLDLITVLVDRAEENLGVAMPGRTHFQHAQPVMLSHHLLAHAWPLQRDIERMREWRKRASLSPYGAGALAGSTLGLDPNLVALELGLAGPTQNSMDATASR